MEKTKPNTTKACIRQSKEKYYNQNKHKKLKPGLVAFYNIWPGNEAGLFSKEKMSNGADKTGKGEEKKISGEAYDINKQTIYIAPKAKSKTESREHYVPEPA